MITDDILEAFKYAFSRPGALTPPINYYRNMLYISQKKAGGPETTIEIPTLVVWVCGHNKYLVVELASSAATPTISSLTL